MNEFEADVLNSVYGFVNDLIKDQKLEMLDYIGKNKNFTDLLESIDKIN